MLSKRLLLTATVFLGIIAITTVAVQASIDSNEQVNISITYPRMNQVVPTSISIGGTVSGEILENQYMWVLVNPQSCPGQYWPQGDSHVTPVNGQWSWLAHLGGENDGGKLFDVLVVLVDNTTDEDFAVWVYNGKLKNDYPSIAFPVNAEIKDRVTLIRSYSNN